MVDPVQAVRARAGELVGDLIGPPYDLESEEILKAVNIKQVRYAKTLTADGRIFWEDGGYVVEISRKIISARRPFTVGHEIGHALFLPLDTKERAGRIDKSVGGFGTDDEEEYLCDVAAAEMLMPKGPFVERVCNYGPSAMSLLMLAKEFGTSLSSTARRFTEVNAWKCHVGFWNVGKDSNPTLQFGFGSGRLRLEVPQGFRAPINNLVTVACTERRGVRGWSDIGLVSNFSEPIGEVFVDAVCVSGGRLVVTFAILEKHPEQLCSMADMVAKRRRDTAHGQAAFRFPGLG